ncbi:MAG: pitrilysin family protein [Planctomycetaceae bacterium]
MSAPVSIHTLANGLTLVVEPMRDVRSAAFSFLVPAGSVHDPVGQNGTAAILSDLITRGAGDLDSRQLTSALDNLGLQHNETVGVKHLGFSAATVADRLPQALVLYGDILRRPHLPADQFDACCDGLEMMLRAMEDEPRQKAMVELRRRCFPVPWSFPTDGHLDDLPSITAEGVCDHFARLAMPNGSILGVAGHVDPDQILSVVEEVFGDWEAGTEAEVVEGSRGPAIDHIAYDSTQTHIGIAYDAVPYRHEDYYAAWAAVGVLSGGMSARLFTEVRERRSLCYAISAVLNSLPHDGRVLCYAGTTAKRAQETLEVTLGEMIRLGEGIEPGELERCQARAKSSLIMQQESTVARAGSLARDWFHLGRITTLDEVRQKIEALTVETVLEYIDAHPAADFTVLTIGPEPLEVPSGVS